MAKSIALASAHPGWLRCSSVTYRQYAPSSRLEGGAPRRPGASKAGRLEGGAPRRPGARPSGASTAIIDRRRRSLALTDEGLVDRKDTVRTKYLPRAMAVPRDESQKQSCRARNAMFTPEALPA